jgi:hypothetical protein
VTEEHPIYKLVPYRTEDRGNLKMVGMDIPVDFQEIKKLLVVHIRENMNPSDMAVLTGQLRTVFGEETVLFATKEKINFFVAEPMSEEERVELELSLKEKLNTLLEKLKGLT